MDIFKRTSSLCLCVCLVGLFSANALPDPGSANHQLLKELTDSYPIHGRSVIPRRNLAEAVDVGVSLSFPQIASVDQNKPSVRFRCYLRLGWTDDFLKWDPEKYGGVKSVQMPSDQIWFPDITIWELISETCTRGDSVTVSHKGMVQMIQDCLHEVQCSLNIATFPFDTQECNYTMASFQHDDRRLNITDIDMDPGYVKHSEWEIINSDLFIARETYTNALTAEEFTMPMVRVSFLIRHDVPLFAFLLILPAALLSGLTAVVFLMPSHFESKADLGLAIFVAFMVLLNLLMDSVPKSSHEMPYLGYYFTLISILIAMSVFCSTIIFRIYSKSSTHNTMSPRKKKLLIAACKILRIQTHPTPTTKPKPAEKENSFAMEETENLATRNTSASQHSESEKSNDYILLAQLLNRFFFILYFIINVIGTLVIFCMYKSETLWVTLGKSH